MLLVSPLAIGSIDALAIVAAASADATHSVVVVDFVAASVAAATARILVLVIVIVIVIVIVAAFVAVIDVAIIISDDHGASTMRFARVTPLLQVMLVIVHFGHG